MDTIHAGTPSGPAVPAFDSHPDRVISGAELAHARRLARLSLGAVGAGMGVSESRVRWIEASVRTTPEAATRFLASLSKAVADREAQR
jgi:hypothetical protein